MDKKEQSLAVARLYYESGRSQQDIAQDLGLSRPTVSRLLHYAREQGFVEITIHDPAESLQRLAERMQRRYGLHRVYIAPAPMEELAEQEKAMGEKTAEFLSGIVQDGMTIGIAWGNVLYEMAKALRPRFLRDVRVVQLKGGMSLNQNSTHAYEILERVTQAFGARGYYLPLPVMFDTVQVKNIVEEDRGIKNILDIGRQADIAVFTVGAVQKESQLFHLGYYITDQEKAMLEEKAVGDVCSRFYDADGKIVDPSIDARTVGISLPELKRIPMRILAAGGRHKLRAIEAALRGGLADVFITDAFTARAILAHEKDTLSSPWG
ncbi:MAG: sugar-binding transcriptional regulator [Selenomonadaceae bacterium]|nr:sugar-binding transcriptional regulator [Selenomonadaceae bacterium]MDY2686375.1 sugar-binding transcriptional regulator [Selenomonadaceae bacterium]